ncbi:hypothetical protein ACIRPK_10275 [Kitasatospora sp. NPDC101801]|uniref:hypothetical protein n=1 Tax=Kitasatospora sp. NPDC101801 TaxID=3364103 RepID=UPI00382DF59C
MALGVIVLAAGLLALLAVVCTAFFFLASGSGWRRAWVSLGGACAVILLPLAVLVVPLLFMR